MVLRGKPSIERLIVASAAILFAVLGFFLYLAIRQNAYEAADEAFDRVLGAAALSIADTVEFENGMVTVDIPYSAFAILGTSRLNRIFYRVVAPDGSIVTGSPILGLELPHAEGTDLRLSDSTIQDEPIRIAAIGRYRSDADTGEAGWIDVLVAETREARDQLAAQLTVNAVLPAVSIAVLAFGLIWFGIRKAFSPLRSLEQSLRQRSQSDLSPITGQVPREIDALVDALNQFMARLDSTLEGLKRVTADAAHQLRTPLTAVRAQAEMALEETDPREIRRRVVRINDNAVNASVLANQWLADATLLHHLKSREAEPVDLRAKVEAAVGRLESEGRFAARLRALELDLPAGRVEVLAEPVSLIEMIRNILENAFLHGAGKTVLSIRTGGQRVRLTVDDDGKGIPPDRREAVFERFVRDTNAGPGSGLGLAIVRDVVTALDGTVALGPSPNGGLRVDIDLPALSRSARAPSKRSGAVAVLLAMAIGIQAVWTPGTGHAQETATIVSPISPERFGPVLAVMEETFPTVEFSYEQMRSPEIAAAVRTRAEDAPDIVIMTTPDISVSLTNEGLAARLEPSGAQFDPRDRENWREELYVLAHDPAVLVFRPPAVEGGMPPRTRLALTQMLEQSPTPHFQRVGIVNVGIDSVAYGLAAQDSLRSPLFWRLASAFGVAQARIYDTSAELLEAMDAGDIDIGYNVPLSEIFDADIEQSAIGYIKPQDYVLSLPWTVFSPRTSSNPLSGEIIGFLLTPQGRETMAAIGIGSSRGEEIANYQRIDLGPELLVFLDTIKRSRFLDSWFQLTTSM